MPDQPARRARPAGRRRDRAWTRGTSTTLFDLVRRTAPFADAARGRRTTRPSTCSAAATRPTSSPSCGRASSGTASPARSPAGRARSGWPSPAAAPSPTAACSASSWSGEKADAGSASSTRRWSTSRGSATSSRSARPAGGSRTSPTTGCWSRPRPAQPGRLPFWKGDALGRPAELGAAIGAFTRELVGAAARAGRSQRAASAGLDDVGRRQPGRATSTSSARPPASLPSDRTLAGRAVPRRARRLAAGRPLALRHAGARPVGAGDQRPAARALRHRRARRWPPTTASCSGSPTPTPSRPAPR